MSLETTILSGLVYNEEYMRKVFPFLKGEYFLDEGDRAVFSLVESFIVKYNNLPSLEALSIELTNASLNTFVFDKAKEVLSELSNEPINLNWMLDSTQKFIKDRAIHNAIIQSIKIMNGEDKTHTPSALPEILTNALAVGFDTKLGHDYFKDAKERFDSYHEIEDKIPFRLKLFNDITKGGLSRKTLNVILAGTGVGKTLVMCDYAADNLLDGHNVLYITMEMSEKKIAERIDAKLLDVTLDELKLIPAEVFAKKVAAVKKKTLGRLKIKEYPTAGAGAQHFATLINELRLKDNFVPDILYIDYINICISSRLKMGANVNSYTYIKSIAEELRGLGVVNDIPIVTATQTTRSGYDSSDPDLTDTSESFGLPATADLMFALINTEELRERNQLLVKQLKNRYNDAALNRKFVVGVDRSKMTLYDIEDSGQIDDQPIMDKGAFSQFDSERTARKSKFQGIK